MTTRQLSILLLLSSLIIIVLTAALDTYSGLDITWGMRLKRRLIVDFIDISLLNCMVKCLLYKNCKSINYFEATHLCELNYGNQADPYAEFVGDFDFVYSKRTDWTKIVLPATCSQCLPGSRCDETDGGHSKLSDCNEYGTVANGYIHRTSGTGVNRYIHLKCDTGYKAKGTEIVWCEDKRVWSSSDFNCVQACDMPYSIQNSVYKPDMNQYEVGQKVTYTCNAGTIANVQSAVSTCLSNGEWTDMPLQCAVGFCTDPPYVAFHRLVNHTTPLTYGARALYVCDYGYEDKGDKAESLCGDTLKWSTVNLQCQKCKVFNNSYTKQPNSLFKYGIHYIQSYDECKESCDRWNSCVAFYTKKQSPWCRISTVRYHDSLTFKSHYTSDNLYDEYIRNCK